MTRVILKNDLFNEILLTPAREFDELCIISGFATPAMASHQLEAIRETYNREDLKVNLIVGMTPTNSGISKAHHKNFIKLMNDKNVFQCSYLNPEAVPTHSKLYIWLKDGEPQKAFIASANYSLTAFLRAQDEVATECDPVEAYTYYQSKLPLSWCCHISEAESLVRAGGYGQRLIDKEEQAVSQHGEGTDWVKLPLFSERTETVQNTAGLNWGHRAENKYNREKNQAYIHIPSRIAKTEFFPPLKQEFSVITDDGFPFIFVRAQPKIKGGEIGFALETPNNNSELGRYFRNRLGLEDGVFVNIEDLDRFGNRYVKFTKINEEEYYMEFNPNK